MIDCHTAVVGSGFGGSAPALRLSEAGYDVHLVERGPRLGPPDFRKTQSPAYIREFLQSINGDGFQLSYIEAYGGASPFYEMVSLRSPSAAFEQRGADQRRYWPRGLDRPALDPFYDLAERTLGVRRLPHDRIPKTAQVFAQMLGQRGRQAVRMPMAIGDCKGAGFCMYGCVHDAKRALFTNYLPAAEAAGTTTHVGWKATTLHPLSLSESGGRRLRWRLDCEGAGSPPGGSRLTFRANTVVLAGGTIGTAKLLLRNRPNLPDLSDQVGRNIASTGSVKAMGLLPEHLPDVDNFTGPTMSGVASYSFLESHGMVVYPAKPLPLRLTTAARLTDPGRGPEARHWGSQHVELMQQYRRRCLVLVGISACPPLARLTTSNGELRLSLEDRARQTEVEREWNRQLNALEQLLARSGCRVLDIESIGGDGRPKEENYFGTTHHTGTCRMSDSPETGVVSPSGELFGHEGIFVTDGAALPASPGVNPSLTILANSERIAAGLVQTSRETR